MAFLSILIVRESHLIVSYDFENVVLAFACLNYFLPAIGLYQLCLSDFGQRGKTLELDGVYHLSHLVLVNVPYLAVRIYLWSGFGSDISMFVMKNVIAIVYSLKEIVPDLMTLHRQCRGRQAVTEPAKCAEEALELEPNHWISLNLIESHWVSLKIDWIKKLHESSVNPLPIHDSWEKANWKLMLSV